MSIHLSGLSGAAIISSSPTVRASNPSRRHKWRVHATGSSASPLLKTTIFVFSIAASCGTIGRKQQQWRYCVESIYYIDSTIRSYVSANFVRKTALTLISTRGWFMGTRVPRVKVIPVFESPDARLPRMTHAHLLSVPCVGSGLWAAASEAGATDLLSCPSSLFLGFPLSPGRGRRLPRRCPTCPSSPRWPKVLAPPILSQPPLWTCPQEAAQAPETENAPVRQWAGTVVCRR